MLSLRTKIGLYVIHGFEGVHFCSVWSELYMSQYKHRLFSFIGRVVGTTLRPGQYSIIKEI